MANKFDRWFLLFQADKGPEIGTRGISNSTEVFGGLLLVIRRTMSRLNAGQNCVIPTQLF